MSGSDRAIAILSNVGAFAYYGYHKAWISDGFTLKWDAAPTATTFKFSYLVINGGNWDSGRLTTPTTATNNVDTTIVPTLTKRGLLLTGVQGVTTAAIQTINTYTLGATDGTTTSVIAAIDEDAQATMDSYRYSDTGTVATGNIAYLMGYDAAIVDRGTFDSFGSTTFRLDWPVKGAVANHYNWVVLADYSTQVTTTKTHKYNLIVILSTTKTHKYNLLSKVSTPKTHKYNVTSALVGDTKTQVVRFQKSTGGNGTTQDVTLNFTPIAIQLFSDASTF